MKRRCNSTESSGVDVGIRRWKREEPPAHYTLKIESFSKLCEILKKIGVDKYETHEFESGGYKWRSVLYPLGKTEKDGSPYLSLYLAIVDPNALWFTRCDHDKVYLFQPLKAENGIDQLISLEMFRCPSNGYLVDDCCEFGVEVHVNKYGGKGETFSIIKEPADGTFTWKIQMFSTLREECHISHEFSVANRKWKLLLYPKGESRTNGKSLSLFLQLVTANDDHTKLGVYTEFKLKVIDQVQESHCERKGYQSFSSCQPNCGFSRFMPVRDVYDISKGYLVNDTLIVEAEILLLTAVQKLS